MERPILTVLTLLVILFGATVCKAGGAKSDAHQQANTNIIYHFGHETSSDAIKGASMRVHNFSLEICGDPTRIDHAGFDDVDPGASRAFTKIGATVLYNLDW